MGAHRDRRAGKDRGLLMMPQVDEEVIVGFENGDTRRRYVLGSLSTARTRPARTSFTTTTARSRLQSDKEIVVNAKDEMTLTSTRR